MGVGGKIDEDDTFIPTETDEGNRDVNEEFKKEGDGVLLLDEIEVISF
jgi:hypothetical protein